VEWRRTSTTREQTIRFWWRSWPDSIPAIDLAKSGLIVVDADRGHRDGEDGVAALAALESANEPFENHPLVRTYSGGHHHVFKQPGGEPHGNAEGQLKGLGINVRGDGGYIIAPGSVISAGSLLWDGTTSATDGEWVADDDAPDLIESFKADTIPEIPAWLVAIIKTPKVERASPSATEPQQEAPHTDDARGRAFAKAALDGCYDELAALTDGRNGTLNDVAFRRGRMVARGWLDELEVI
jgi:hypothetical protein